MRYFMILLACLLAAAVVVGETGQVKNPGCPKWAQEYRDVTCH